MPALQKHAAHRIENKRRRTEDKDLQDIKGKDIFRRHRSAYRNAEKERHQIGEFILCRICQRIHNARYFQHIAEHERQ